MGWLFFWLAMLLFAHPADDAPVRAIEAALERGRPNEALALLERSDLRLDEFDRLIYRARAESALGNWAAARKALQRAVRQRPEDAPARLRLGCALAALRSDAQAVEQFEAAAALGLDSFELHLEWARVAARRGNLLGQCRVVQIAAPGGRPPEPGQIIDRTVVLESAAGNNQAVVCDSSAALYHALRAVALRADAAAPIPVPDAGRDDASAPPATGGDDGRATGEAWLIIGKAWQEAARPRSAAEAYRRAVAELSGPERDAAYEKLAAAYLELDDFDAYFSCLRRRQSEGAGLDRPRLAAAYSRAAAAMAERGDLAGQIRYLRLAQEIEPKADRHVALGDALALDGRPREAAVHWRAALELRPDHPQRSALLARIRRAESE